MPALHRSLSAFFFMRDHSHRGRRMISDSHDLGTVVPGIVSDVAEDCLSILPYGDILDVDIFLVNRTASVEHFHVRGKRPRQFSDSVREAVH
jgi:hypothetical protein